MADVQNREPFVRGLPSSRVLEREIKRAGVQLNGDGHQADMGLSIIGRRPVIDTSPGPTSVVEPQAEDVAPADPTAPKIDDGIGPFLGAKLDAVLAELKALNVVPPFNPGTPTSTVGQLSTNSADYVDVASWIIPSDRVGSLQEISISSDNPALAQFLLEIANEEQWRDITLDSPLTIPFRENQLSGDTEVVVRVLSDGTTTFTAFASIAGVEREV